MTSMPKQQEENVENLSSKATTFHYRMALFISIILTLLAMLILPFARQAVPKVPAFLPSYAMLASFADLLTAYLLFGQFLRARTPTFGVLAATYYYSSLTSLLYILTFPDVFSPTGLLHANPQTAVWLFVCWHIGFPSGILLSLRLDQRYGTTRISPRRARTLFLCFLLGIPLLVALLALLAIDPSRQLPPPPLIVNTVYTLNFTVGFGLIAGVITLVAGANICLRFRRLTIIQLWLGVTLLATFLELVLNIYAAKRYALGWYLARSSSLLAAMMVLGVLLFEVNRLYAKLAQQHDALEKQNDALETTNTALLELNKRQKGLVSVVSHEFRSALTSIVGFSDLLRGAECNSQEIQEFATIINNDAKRTTRLINDMLDLSRMESGQMKFRLESLNLNTIIEEAVARVRPTIPHHVQLRLDTTLPVLPGDADKLVQVVTNVLNNASKYSPEGGTILVSSEDTGGFFHLSIQDHGIGIPQDKLGQVFEPYTRVTSDATRAIGGTGLGLSIVREIILQHEGKIWVESQLGEGSTFHIMLPFAGKASLETDV